MTESLSCPEHSLGFGTLLLEHGNQGDEERWNNTTSMHGLTFSDDHSSQKKALL